MFVTAARLHPHRTNTHAQKLVLLKKGASLDTGLAWKRQTQRGGGDEEKVCAVLISWSDLKNIDFVGEQIDFRCLRE